MNQSDVSDVTTNLVSVISAGVGIKGAWGTVSMPTKTFPIMWREALSLSSASFS